MLPQHLTVRVFTPYLKYPSTKTSIYYNHTRTMNKRKFPHYHRNSPEFLRQANFIAVCSTFPPL